MQTRLILSCVALAALGSTALAVRTPHKNLGGGRPIDVIAYAPIDADGRVIGPWIEPGVGNDFSPNFIVFDLFEADPNGASGIPTEWRTPNWGEGSARYNFGVGWKNCFCINDFNVTGGYAGGKIKRANFAFSQNGGASEQMFISIKIYDTFTNTPTPPGASGFIEGYVANLGTVAPDAVNYYYGNLTLTGSNDWDIPADGSGAYEIKLLKQLSPELQSTAAEPMLWIIKPNQQNAGSQNLNQWDDDNPTLAYGTHQAQEFYQYDMTEPFPTGNTTLEPMGAMMGFYADYAPTAQPAGYTFIQGTEFAGTLSSLFTSDDDALSGFNDESSLQCELETFGTVFNSSPTTFVVKVEMKVDRPGLSYQINQFNYNTNAFQNLGGGVSTLNDTPYQINVTTTPSRFIRSSDKQVKTRVLIGPINDEDPSQDGWLHYWDVITWQSY
jgi:hypothetical protein